MPNSCVSTFLKAVLSVLVIAFGPFAHSLPDADLSDGVEDEPESRSHFDRPDILNLDLLSLTPSKISALKNYPSRNPDSHRRAHLVLAAQLFELYPKHDVYFVGLESARMYDAARLVTKDTAEARRVHLLSVSRNSIHDKRLDPYLEENGISERSLRNGKKILLFNASPSSLTSTLLKRRFSLGAQQNIETHYALPRSPGELKSKAFLSMLSSAWESSGHDSQFHTYTEKYLASNTAFAPPATHYRLIGNQWNPMTPLQNTIIGTFLGERAFESEVGDMFALRDYWAQEEAKELYFEARTLTRQLRELLASGDVLRVKQLIAPNDRMGQLARAITQDLLAFMAQSGVRSTVKAAELDLREVKSRNDRERERLLRDYPEWRRFIEDPEAESFDIVQSLNKKRLFALQKQPFPVRLRAVLYDELFRTNEERFEQMQVEFIHRIAKDDLWMFKDRPRALLQNGMKRQALAIFNRFSGTDLGRIMISSFGGVESQIRCELLFASKL